MLGDAETHLYSAGLGRFVHIGIGMAVSNGSVYTIAWQEDWFWHRDMDQAYSIECGHGESLRRNRGEG